ncbi:Ger(x)C family spore germination protein [Gorillibacterium sp. CAU 1737]|uniref:Ger(x)C family spore germination protein n=1 Tax=Gorillibacterium sp. CAU 1737 TaxID=3140362 RepID=UPI0032609590
MRKAIRRLLLSFLVITMALCTGGCWNRKEVNTIMIVLGVGIDRLSDNRVEVTVQLYNSTTSGPGGNSGNQGEGSGGGKIQSSTGQTMVISASGTTTYDAVNHLQRKLSRTLFWGHSKTIIFGEQAAKKGIKMDMDFFLRFSQTRERTRVLVGKGTARSYLEARPLVEATSALGIMVLVEQQYGIDRNLKDLAEGLLGESHAVALPLLHFEGGVNGREDIKSLQGCALIHNGFMKSTLDTEKTRGMLWAENHSRWIKMPVSVGEGEFVNLQPLRSTAGFEPSIEKGVWKLEVEIRAELVVLQNASALTLDDPHVIKRVERDANKLIIRDVEKTMSDLQELNVDALQVAQMFHRKYPKEFNKVQKQWDKVFPTIKITAKAECRIARTGMYTNT